MFSLREMVESALGIGRPAMPQRPALQNIRFPAGTAEDDAFIGSTSNLNQYSPANADIRNFSENSFMGLQPQAYSTQMLYQTPEGRVPTYKPQQPRFGAYLQRGGVPTHDGGIFEDAYGGNLNNYMTKNLKVR